MKTDWINSKPIFYNTKTLETSDNMLKVWQGGFDNEGLYDFLTFGYQVFEQTALKNVKKLRHSSEIINGLILNSPDPIEKYIGRESSVDEALDTLETHILIFLLFVFVISFYLYKLFGNRNTVSKKQRLKI